ncbi:MAG: nitroreductase [Flavobacteriales bacterium]|jgi:nitroreductase
MKYNLSEITEIIRQRRSITPEQFAPRKVHREQLEIILNNALWAPSHGMTQPWRFKVFTEQGLERLQEFIPGLYRKTTPLEKFNQAKFDRMQMRLEKTSVVIALCMERDPSGKIAEIEEIEAVACAAQNMMLTCTAYGLGAFWSTPKFLSHPDMHAFLNLGEADKCLGLFYIGYPAGEWPASHRKPLEYVTEWISTAS